MKTKKFSLLTLIGLVFCFGLLLVGCTEPHEHNLVFHEALSSTCENDGNIAYYECLDCGEFFTTKEANEKIEDKESVIIKATGHDIEFVDELQSTCTQKGYIEHYTCKLCGKIYQDAEGTVELRQEDVLILETGHLNLVHIKRNEATCVKEGNIEYYECNDCNSIFLDAQAQSEIENIKETIIPATGHTINIHISGTPATCTQDGLKEYYKCQNCPSYFYDEQGLNPITGSLTIPKLGHKMTHHDKVDPDCVNNGNIEYYSCERCNRNFNDEIGSNILENVILNAQGHDMNLHNAVDSTCTSTGNIMYYECNKCHNLYKDIYGEELVLNVSVPKKDHDIVLVKETASTCEKDGNIEYYECSSCHSYFSDSQGSQIIEDKNNVVVPKLGHDYELSYIENINGEYEYVNVCKRNSTHTELVSVAGISNEYPFRIQSGEELKKVLSYDLKNELYIKLIADINADIEIEKGQKVNFNLNGHIITNISSHTISNYGELIIQDSSSEKDGMVDNITHLKAPLVNYVGGKLIINSGNFTRSLENGKYLNNSGNNSYYVLLNYGDVTINDGNFYLDSCYSSLIDNGWYTPSQNTTKNFANLTINGGTFAGGKLTIKNDDYGILLITGGRFENSMENSTIKEIPTTIIFNCNKAVIKGGEFISNNCAYYTYTDGDLSLGYEDGMTEIIGGTFTGNPTISSHYVGSGAQSIVDVSSEQELLSVLEEKIKVYIRLTANIECDLVIRQGQSIVIDLNGYILSNKTSHTISNYGNLKIEDSSNEKDGMVDNITHKKASVANYVGGKLIINSGNFTRSLENGKNSVDAGGNSYYVILNQGDATINGGNIYNNGAFSSLIDNGWYDPNQNTTKTYANLVINGGKFSGGINTLKNDDYGIMTINDGTFENKMPQSDAESPNAVVQNWNLLTINGGTFIANDCLYVIATQTINTPEYEKGITTIKGGIVTGVANQLYYDYAGATRTGQLEEINFSLRN